MIYISHKSVIVDYGSVLMSPTTPVFLFFSFFFFWIGEMLWLIHGKIEFFVISATINHINKHILKVILCFQYYNILLNFSFWKCDDISYKKGENLWLKVSFYFFHKKKKKKNLLIYSFYKVEKNVETVYDYRHDSYYRS